MTKQVRTRFSPSPSGYLHIGGARTALFSWLYARQNNGAFIVRIEDTDTKRSSTESENIILDSLRWLGLNWDEGLGVDGSEHGPYRQSERTDIYKQWADKLIESGKAYRCYCTSDDLDAQRKALTDKNPKAQFKYPGTCRDIKENLDKSYVVRFKAPTEGMVEYNDLVFGNIKTPNVENQDFVILRADGLPLYNFGAVVDDHLMGITHVIRGREHMINTPPQIMLYEALGWDVPHMAHLPLMLDPSGTKLSKRTGSVSVTEYKDNGFTPEGVLNYLARFGWGSGNKEIFSLKDLVNLFSLESCGRNDGKFDMKKFSSVQFEHLKNPDLTSDEEYYDRLVPFLKEKGIDNADKDACIKALPLIRPRAHTLIEAAEEIIPFISDNLGATPDYKDVSGQVKDKVNSLLADLDADQNWEESHLRQITKDWLAKNNLSLKDLGGFMRLSLTGRAHSPELFQVMATLGRGRALKRLGIGVERLMAS